MCMYLQVCCRYADIHQWSRHFIVFIICTYCPHSRIYFRNYVPYIMQIHNGVTGIMYWIHAHNIKNFVEPTLRQNKLNQFGIAPTDLQQQKKDHLFFLLILDSLQVQDFLKIHIFLIVYNLFHHFILNNHIICFQLRPKDASFYKFCAYPRLLFHVVSISFYNHL
jgi:hypothetical protein